MDSFEMTDDLYGSGSVPGAQKDALLDDIARQMEEARDAMTKALAEDFQSRDYRKEVWIQAYVHGTREEKWTLAETALADFDARFPAENG